MSKGDEQDGDEREIKALVLILEAEDEMSGDEFQERSKR